MKIKNFPAKILLAGLLVNLLSMQAGAMAFSDVGSNHPGYLYINYFYEQGIFSGYPDGTFQPDRVLNRAEQLKIYMLLAGISPDANIYKNCFDDVGEEWFARYVCYAKTQGIVQGYGDGYFRPAQQVNKVEALKMLAETQNWNLITASTASFGDTPLTEWYSTYVETARKWNLIDGGENLFEPAAGISRAQTAELMFRSLAMLNWEQIYATALDEEITQIDLHIATNNTPSVPIGADDPLLVKNYALTPEDGQVKVGNYYNLSFSLQDSDGSLIKGAKLEIKLERPFVALNPDYAGPTVTIPYSETDGVYQAQVMSQLAGKNVLSIRNVTTGQLFSDTLEFKPDTPYQLTLISQSGPGGNSQLLGQKNYQLMLADRYGNKIETATYSITSNDGDVSLVKKYNGVAEVKLKAKTYGPASFQIKAVSNGVEKTFNQTVDFLPIGLGGQAAYPIGEQTISLPVLLFLPDKTTGLENVEYNLELPGNLNVIGVNLDSALDGEALAPIKTPEGRWRIGISGKPQFSGGFDGKIGDLLLGGLPEGKFNLDSETQLLFNTPDYKETLYRNGGKTQQGENTLYVPMQRPLAQIAGKSEKRICLDVLIQPGTNITAAMVESDMKQAEDIFYKNAQSCNCPHYLKIDYSTYTFTNEQWNQITGGDGTLGTLDYVDFINSSNPPIRPHTWCTKMFYVNNTNSATEIGESIRTQDTDNLPGVGSFIKLDNSRDADGRSFAHELAHHLSGNRIDDPGDANGATQGAGRPGNLMSYDEADDEGNITEQLTGDNLTADQCGLIYWDHSRFSNYPAK